MTDQTPNQLARVTIWFDQVLANTLHASGTNTFQVYVGEILAHAGISFDWTDQPPSPGSCNLLIVALAPDDIATAQHIVKFAEQGGGVIVLPGHDTLASSLGCTVGVHCGTGYAHLPGTPAAETSLRFLAAAPWPVTDAGSGVEPIGSLHMHEPGGAPIGSAILRFAIGKGVIERWAVDPASTVVALQQGTGPVLKDGIPAPDGSGAIDEGILKADDGFALDWTLDRVTTETGQPYFPYAYADLWREVFIHRLLRLALEHDWELPFVDTWPADAPNGVALISHDSDGNEDDTAITTLGLLREAGIHSTWCIIEPGYSPAVYKQVKAEGHELAFHYNSVEHEKYRWDAADFTRQFEALRQATGVPFASNKNHYTRFEGWGDLFRWLELAHIGVDQTRGSSKRGNVGMLFGTCHPFFPVAWHDEGNRLYDVLELGFLTQDMDLGSWADSSVIVPFADQVQRVRGVAHFLFHPVHLHKQPAVRDAFHKVIAELRQRGFVFWTSQQIGAWERKRRTLRADEIYTIRRGEASLPVSSQPGSNGDASPLQPHVGVVWVPVPDGTLAGTGETLAMRFGILCRGLTIPV